MARRPIRKLTLSIRGFDTVNEVAKSRDRRTRPRWGIAGAVALLTALAAPLVTAQPAFAVGEPNGTIAIVPASATVADGRIVTVPWTLTQGGTAATGVTATITPVGSAVVTAAGTCDDTGILPATLACTFTAGTAGGSYTITATLTNGAGAGTGTATDSEVVVVAKPTGAVLALDAEVDGSDVTVTWDRAGVTNWGTTGGQDFEIEVTSDDGEVPTTVRVW